MLSESRTVRRLRRFDGPKAQSDVEPSEVRARTKAANRKSTSSSSSSELLELLIVGAGKSSGSCSCSSSSSELLLEPSHDGMPELPAGPTMIC